ncbi:aldo/keto reductase [Oceanomicrobium pacificus]|uniref:Aldo/keto reductase n=1 Tax=Oceanomicrobium pacificus TaxID=2692916 RepID=A0A6B0TL96_9RHOB|nr:aldo/keto reductase [Oceanomicrobium pacificus]MXU65277.1 aldo/keto reductase [Oceanomicrobium pacificus]
MSDTTLGPNGVRVSKLTFGTMQFGGKADARASAEIYAACRDAGITMFDTAYSYTDGRSEEILGDLVRPERDQVIVATKVAASGGSGQANIVQQFDSCLKRLKLDHVDLLYLHRWDPDTPLEVTLEAMNSLYNDGRFSHLGVSNFAAWQVVKSIAIARAHGFRPPEVLQPMYNLVKRQAEVEILPMALSEGVQVYNYSPLGGGLLTGKYARGGDGGRLTHDKMYAARYAPDWMHDAAVGLSDLAAEAGIHPITAAIAWTAKHPGITAPIISGTSAAQIEPALAAMHLDLDDDLYARISALVPTPPPATDRLEEQAG